MALLAVDPASASKDLQHTTRLGKSSEISAYGAASDLMGLARFQTWLGSDEPGTLLVGGGALSAPGERISPMSFMCSTLIETLSNMEPAVTIHFFCGLHLSSGDNLRGPTGIIRSLITQVLHQSGPKLDFINSRIYRNQLQDHDLNCLCDCFVDLVKQCPMDTVLFCVIDGISFYETAHWREDLCLVVGMLRDLTNDDEVNAIFKLLITCPSRSRFIAKSIPPQDRLALSDATEDDRRGISERQAMMQSRRSTRVPMKPFVRQFMLDGSEDEKDKELDTSGSDTN